MHRQADQDIPVSVDCQDTPVSQGQVVILGSVDFLAIQGFAGYLGILDSAGQPEPRAPAGFRDILGSQVRQ